MFGKNTRMNRLVSRKQLLIAESELNRAQLAQEWSAMATGIHSMTDRAKSFSSILSAAAALVAGLAAFRRGQRAPGGAEPSRLQTMLKVAGLVSTFWLAYRARSR